MYQNETVSLGRTYGRPARPSAWPPAVFPLALAIFIAGGLGPNILLAITALIVLLLGCKLLWRPGESPILLFAFAYSWVQASVSIFHANWLGIAVSEFMPFTGDIQTAILISLGGILALALGMRLGAGPWRRQDSYGFRAQAHGSSYRYWLWLYFIAWAAGIAALALAWKAPGLSQPLLALAAMKWVFFFILAYAAFVGAPDSHWFAIVFLIELASGIGGYFSDFKTVFFVTIFAAIASGVRFSMEALIGLGVLGSALLAFGIVWTSIKGEYRNYVSGGEAAQIVAFDYGTRIEKLGDLVEGLDEEKLQEGADQFFHRLSYVEYFAVVLDYVPTHVPYEKGALLWDSVSRPFMPRLLFPGKSVIDDNVRTNYYTGGIAGDNEGTSISLGWIAEMYIDFGYFGMFPAIMGIGIFFGRIYRGFLRWNASRGLIGMGLANAVLIGASALENSFTKAFGGIMAALLVAWLLAKFFLPRQRHGYR